jgi:predicted amidohydrolase
MYVSSRIRWSFVVFASFACGVLFSDQSLALEREVVVTVYQGPCKDGDFTANLATAREAIHEARARGSHFLVFPEEFLSGCDSLEHLRSGARRLDDPELSAFIKETADHDLVVLAGLARLTEEGIYNSVLVIERGRVLGIYDKVIPTGSERRRYGVLPGKSVRVFEAHGARFAVVICHDSSFPHAALLARLRGAEILFTPHYNFISPQTMDDHRRWVRNCHVGLACQMKMAVARANVVVTDKEDRLGYGDSFVLSPQGEVLAQAELFRTELVTATITPAMFKHPYVWASLDEVPKWLRAELADRLTAD